MTNETGSNQNTDQSANKNTETFIITEFKSGGIDKVKSFLENNFATYSEEVSAEVPQICSEDGRKRIKALGVEINKKLSEYDTPMRDYLRDIKKQPKLIEAIAKENKEKFTKLRADVLEPLQEAQKSQDEVIAWLNNVPSDCGSPSINVQILNNIIETINGYTDELVWPELKKKFKVAHENALTTATVTLERVEESEKQAAELAELRAKQAKAEQDEHDRKVAEDAKKQADIDAEEKIRKDREDAERRAAEAKQREEQAEADKQKAIRDAELAEERRKQEAEDNAKREAQAKINAELTIKAAKEKAEYDEKKRAEEEAAQAEQDAKDREANKEHRIKINRAAMVAFIGAGLSEGDAKIAVTVIAQRKVPNCLITY